eukprot:TRINITY_DN12720_c0_g2_i3.p1 TRINITY_DN12720_c0_g2~~TRINITY_DN12720_c0_g2_i3.p1  ORF type:complete len:136 (+),score=20.58 TRINITY_DN12720_c0_g2_i3:101-508(+)
MVRQMVMSVISLVQPLTFMGDYRPYVTLYDDDIKSYTAVRDEGMPLVVMGACNPHLASMLENFPAVLHLEKEHCLENKLVAPHRRSMSEFLRTESFGNIKSFIEKVLKTKERLYLSPNKELLKNLKDKVHYARNL